MTEPDFAARTPSAPPTITSATPGAASRRGWLAGGAAALAAAAVAPGIRLIEVAQAAPSAGPTGAGAGEGANPKVRWGLLIDSTKCDAGCDACVKACGQENGLSSTLPDRQRPQWIRKVALTEIKSGRQSSAPMMCQHCAEPPCVDVCPTGASFKRADGLVLVDRHACIGCRYCMMACPYKARSFVHEPLTGQAPRVPRGQGCVEGCTLCVQRIDRGGTPACVEACAATGRAAMLFGDLNDSESAIARRLRELGSVALRADLGLDPGVRYHGL
ncbi:MAG TPA: 4Fe-4S dicluster domain-containing protein [Burkholderiaceae bacterium]|nr:4Fe-4S dicluster domain-containing protein [Burkholderiaceae bacterium]HNG78895.1 4Fe-4S dicluster domain-containing protein [Burkholderiaceae bacterium]